MDLITTVSKNYLVNMTMISLQETWPALTSGSWVNVWSVAPGQTSLLDRQQPALLIMLDLGQVFVPQLLWSTAL